MESAHLKFFAFFLIIAISGCGTGTRKPMQLSAIEGANEEQRDLLLSGVLRFNEIVGEQLVSAEKDGYQLAFFVRSQQALTEIAPGTPNTGVRHGYADSSSERCLISVSEELFNSAKRGILLSVIVHELGHCAGLGHKGTFGKIMSEYPSSFGSYKPEDIAEFRTDLRAVLDLPNYPFKALK